MNRRGFLKGLAGSIAGVCSLGMATAEKEPLTFQGVPIRQTDRLGGTVSDGNLIFDEEACLKAIKELENYKVRVEGCDDWFFSDPHEIPGVVVRGQQVVLKEMPKYRYLRVNCNGSSFKGAFVTIGKEQKSGLMDSCSFLVKDDVLDFGQRWQEDMKFINAVSKNLGKYLNGA